MSKREPKRDCVICAKWPPAVREAMRNGVTLIPADQWVCDDCLVAFFINIATHSRISERPHQGDRS